MNQKFRTRTMCQKPIVTRVVMRAIVGSLLLATMISYTASAQTGAPGASVYSEGRANHAPVPRTSQAKKSVIDKRLESLTEQLNLSQVQRVQTRKILEDGQAESLHLWSDQQIAPIDRMVKLRSIREDAHKRFRALLTEEQRIKYDQIFNREIQAYSLPHSQGPATAGNKSQ
jgi:hypothetical protein